MLHGWFTSLGDLWGKYGLNAGKYNEQYIELIWEWLLCDWFYYRKWRCNDYIRLQDQQNIFSVRLKMLRIPPESALKSILVTLE
jgi:hypothetical protein